MLLAGAGAASRVSKDRVDSRVSAHDGSVETGGGMNSWRFHGREAARTYGSCFP
jgi:hypothetical protein